MGTSFDFKETGDFGPFDFVVSTNSSEVAAFAQSATETPPGTMFTHPSFSFTADFQNLDPIDITFAPSSGSNDGTFYLDPTIINDTGHTWSGFSLQLVAADPGHFEESSNLGTEHPAYPHFHDANSGMFASPQIGSSYTEGSEVYGYIQSTFDGIDREGKATVESSYPDEIYNGDREMWQYFGVHDPTGYNDNLPIANPPMGGGAFTLELTPITDSYGFTAGDETLLNTSIVGNQAPADYTSNSSPSQLAALSNGQAVAVWDDENLDRVEARIVSASGPVGSQITVGSGNDGTVATLANGNFIVVWWDPTANNGLGEVEDQMYSASGSPIAGTGSLFVGTSSNGTNYGESNLSVTGLADGGYAVSFTFQGNGASPFSQVYTYTYDQSGTNVGNIADGSSSSTVYNGLPQTAQLSGGNLVTTWQDGQGHVYAQIFTESGTSVKQLSLGFPYDTPGTSPPPADSVSHPTVAALADGNFVVAWDDDTQHNIQFDIWNGTGTEAVALNEVASSDYDAPAAPAIAALPNGQFAITWADTGESSIKAALFNPDGSFDNEGNDYSAIVANEIVVNNDQSGNQAAPNIVGLSGGGMYIDWGDSSGQLGDSSGFGVAGQAFGELYSPTTYGTVKYSVAQFLASHFTLDLNGDFIVSDTAANIAANLNALNADPNVSEIILTGSGTPTLTLTAQQEENDWQAIDKIAGPYTIATSTPPNFFTGVAEAGVLWQNSNGDTELWNPTGSGGYVGQALGVVGGGWQIAGTGAFNGASEAGILWRNANGDTALWNPNGSGGFTYQDLGVVDPSWQVAGTGDFNGNGEGILWRNSSGDTALWNVNGSGGYTYQDLGAVPSSWQISGTGDFTGTGADSILWQNSNGDTELWNPNGSGGFVGEDLGVVGGGWQIAGTGDFTGTGKDSILWRNSGGDTELWNPNGSGGFVGQDLGVVPTSWQVAGTGDYSGNGQSGILWRDSNGDTELWNPNGSGGFTGENLGAVPTSWSVQKIFA